MVLAASVAVLTAGIVLAALRSGEDRLGGVVASLGLLTMFGTLLLAVNDRRVSTPQPHALNVLLAFGLIVSVAFLGYMSIG